MLTGAVLAIALFAPCFGVQSQQSQETPKIEAKVQAKNAIPPEHNSKADFKSPMAIAANASNAESTDHTKNTSNERTEFWPPFFGYRLKITDTLLVFFTALLFAATVFLYRATRDLVKGAGDIAKRQLRAYVHVKDVIMSHMNSGLQPNIQMIIKNYGQTPAYRVTNTFTCVPLSSPIEKDFSLDQAQTAELADLGPTQHTFSTAKYPIDRWMEVKSSLVSDRKNKRFYVFGRISYVDAFNDSWETQFRYRLLVDVEGVKDEMSFVIDGRDGNRTT